MWCRTALLIFLLSLPLDLLANTPENTILILYNHGTKNEHDCDKSFLSRDPKTLPKWARDLRGRVIRDEKGTEYNIEVKFICSVEGKDVCSRAEWIMGEIEKHSAVYPRRQIFLAGHSAGAWASLLIKRSNPQSVNGLILTAPAFGGKRVERTCARKTCNEETENEIEDRMGIRTRHEEYLSKSPSNSLDALVVGFPCDAFGWPSELPFGEEQGVDLRLFPPVGEVSNDLDCKDSEHTYYRYFNEEEVRFCLKISNRNKGDEPKCSAERVAYCEEGYQDLCSEKSHLFYDDRQLGLFNLSYIIQPPIFTDWFVEEGIVQKFIEKQLSDWSYADGKETEDPPCEFLEGKCVDETSTTNADGV